MSRIKLRDALILALAASAAARRAPNRAIFSVTRRVGDAAPSLSASPPPSSSSSSLSTLAGRPAPLPRAARRRAALAALKGGARAPRPPALLRVAYAACGLATSAAWTSVVFSAIRSNAPPGASRTRARARPSP